MIQEDKSILVLDDEEMIRDLLFETFSKKGYKVDTAVNGKEAMAKLEENEYSLLISDLRLPDVSGMEVLEKIKKEGSSTGVIMVTAYGSIKNAVNAMKQGAFDYITKPFDLDQLEVIIDKYFNYQNLVEENEYLKSELGRKFQFKNIIGQSKPMLNVFDAIRMVARSRATVLIQGASGTGKELVARAIHYNSKRKNGPFITTNCAALPEGLVESELFGHEKGAFTGAIKTTKGRFELAHGGTILLDEISEISSGLQAKLLRVLQEREIERVGSGHPIQVDVRVIATTNRNLEEEVKKGDFREDLYYRLNVVPIHLPTINERREDIPLLVKHFIKKYAEENELPIKGVTEKANKMLMQREWPGNVREIENCIERTVVMCEPGTEILDIKHFSILDSVMSTAVEKRIEDLPMMTLRESEKNLILTTLRENDNNRTKTAELLGISVRTLRNKLNEYRSEGVTV
ncbi:sigma-54-dependent Fis family transcriptional regulator [bacterium]|nr:sigma-54-dependent Fis family transcriptional regulator [bacterium]